ncbi:hypothetical protein SAMN05216215_103533 [Saccharopolyspora shandongensis]|uniref:Uncharacterized protein n=1 Tax=Saccharopolyspora shandongensis TaxID=418495 RepID=A0A1H3MSF9_9PSEU|nr:hypothetical protein SAMN05216215_103533 [Saccharopolyspora shandongensis]
MCRSARRYTSAGWPGNFRSPATGRSMRGRRNGMKGAKPRICGTGPGAGGAAGFFIRHLAEKLGRPARPDGPPERCQPSRIAANDSSRSIVPGRRRWCGEGVQACSSTGPTARRAMARQRQKAWMRRRPSAPCVVVTACCLRIATRVTRTHCSRGFPERRRRRRRPGAGMCGRVRGSPRLAVRGSGPPRDLEQSSNRSRSRGGNRTSTASAVSRWSAGGYRIRACAGRATSAGRRPQALTISGPKQIESPSCQRRWKASRSAWFNNPSESNRGAS